MFLHSCSVVLVLVLVLVLVVCLFSCVCSCPQYHRYNFPLDERLQLLLSEALLKSKNEDDMYNLSLKIEPRNKKQTEANYVLDTFENMGLF
jgi:hypothetical protein